MTEAEWLGYQTTLMVEFLLERYNRTSWKLRLFVAGWYRIWPALRPPPAIDAAERFADGEASEDELRAAFSGCQHGNRLADMLVSFGQPSGDSKAHSQAKLLRCLFGNPFRPVNLLPEWLTYQGGIVRRLAESAYREHDFGPPTMDALWDALYPIRLQVSGLI